MPGKTEKRVPAAAAATSKATTTKKRAPAKAAAKRPSRTATRSPRRAAATDSGHEATMAGARNLVIVESPAKARTISRILGSDYAVRASLGHVRDLPRNESVDALVKRGFEPDYVVLPAKDKVVRELKALGKNANTIYLATDPDREGEAISWHLVEAAGWQNRPLRRVVFHEITPEAVNEAFKHPRAVDAHLVDAQQARRVLDRVVGYELSPLLWRKVQRGLSAGRVQSVAVRMVVDREREIEAFVPNEYWTIEAELRPEGQTGIRDNRFTALFHSIKGESKLDVTNRAQADALVAVVQGLPGWRVDSVRKREVHQRPSAPFITSTLQQEAWRKLRFSAKKTMAVAQQLYEGVEISGESVALITYMRTDSTHVTPSAINEARDVAVQRYGPAFVPEHHRLFTRKSKGAQEAHEAIRPTSVRRTPESVERFVSRDHFRLYELIWKRMLASQMADALSDATTVDIEVVGRSRKAYTYRATGSVLRFAGFRAVYMEGIDDAEEEKESLLPDLREREPLDCQKVEGQQHFTQPPPRFSEATLIKALEEKGIGRPSTYAPIVSTVQDRGYVEKEQGRLKPTALGKAVTDFLVLHYANIMNYDFTALMEEELDEVARGERGWIPMLKDFYKPFHDTMAGALLADRVKVEEGTNEICELSGHPMVIKTGRFGRFLACTGFPDCKNTKPLLKRTGVECPDDGGQLVERRGRLKGRVFYGCANYPNCQFTTLARPLPEPCPQCGGMLVVNGRAGAKCMKCEYRGARPEAAEPEEAVAAGV